MTKETISKELMKKIISIIFFILIFYVLPLSLKPDLLLNGQVILLVVVCSVLFATQPRLSIAEAKQRKSTDKNTVWLIVLVSGIGQVVSLIEWAYFPGTTTGNSTLVLPFGKEVYNVDPVLLPGSVFNWTVIGAILLISGTLFRLYAIHVLGKCFTSTVQIKAGHKIISNGPYKYLRHPSYTGAYFAMIGSAMFLHSFIGIIIFGIGMLIVYHLRIKTEERTLIHQFGVLYKLYAARTYKMFPMVW